jgi:hypothetical protein
LGVLCNWAIVSERGVLPPLPFLPSFLPFSCTCFSLPACSQFHYINKRTIYVGEWVADVAKCGVMQPEPGRAPHDPPVYPPLELASADAVLFDAVAAVRAASGADTSAGSGGAPESDGAAGFESLTAEDLEQLQHAFASADTAGDGHIPADVNVLVGVLSVLGIEASLADASAVLRELSAAEAGYGESSGDSVSFRAFAETMARLRQ